MMVGACAMSCGSAFINPSTRPSSNCMPLLSSWPALDANPLTSAMIMLSAAGSSVGSCEASPLTSVVMMSTAVVISWGAFVLIAFISAVRMAVALGEHGRQAGGDLHVQLLQQCRQLRGQLAYHRDNCPACSGPACRGPRPTRR